MPLTANTAPASIEHVPPSLAMSALQRSILSWLLTRLAPCAPGTGAETTRAYLGVSAISLLHLQDEPEAEVAVVAFGWCFGRINSLYRADLGANCTALARRETIQPDFVRRRQRRFGQENSDCVVAAEFRIQTDPKTAVCADARFVLGQPVGKRGRTSLACHQDSPAIWVFLSTCSECSMNGRPNTSTLLHRGISSFGRQPGSAGSKPSAPAMPKIGMCLSRTNLARAPSMSTTILLGAGY